MKKRRKKRAPANRTDEPKPPSGGGRVPETSLRIIGGKFRNSRIKYSGDRCVRPMKDRVREARVSKSEGDDRDARLAGQAEESLAPVEVHAPVLPNGAEGLVVAAWEHEDWSPPLERPQGVVIARGDRAQSSDEAREYLNQGVIWMQPRVFRCGAPGWIMPMAPAMGSALI